MREPRASQAGALWLQRALLEHGIGNDDIQAACGIDFDRIRRFYPYYRFPISNLTKLFRFASEKLNEPAIALRLAKVRLKEAHNIRTAAASTAPTNADAIRVWAKYATLDLSEHAVHIEHEREKNEISLISKQSASDPNTWLSEVFLGTAKSLIAWFTRDDFTTVGASFEHAAPHYVEEYHRRIGGKLQFQQKDTRISFRSKQLDQPPPNASKFMHAAFCGQADRLLTELSGDGISIVEIKQMIYYGLQARQVSAQDIAKQIGIDRSTLARQLKNKNTSYSTLLAEVRQEAALRLLMQRCSVNEVAAELAYSEPSAFQHAFQRWYGTSPKRYRELVLAKDAKFASDAS